MFIKIKLSSAWFISRLPACLSACLLDSLLDWLHVCLSILTLLYSRICLLACLFHACTFVFLLVACLLTYLLACLLNQHFYDSHTQIAKSNMHKIIYFFIFSLDCLWACVKPSTVRHFDAPIRRCTKVSDQNTGVHGVSWLDGYGWASGQFQLDIGCLDRGVVDPSKGTTVDIYAFDGNPEVWKWFECMWAIWRILNVDKTCWRNMTKSICCLPADNSDLTILYHYHYHYHSFRGT